MGVGRGLWGLKRDSDASLKTDAELGQNQRKPWRQWEQGTQERNTHSGLAGCDQGETSPSFRGDP